MNADITLSTLSFTQQYSDKTGSLRREVSRGAMLPETLRIAHSDYVDSATKLPGVRSLTRVDRYIALTDDRIAPVSASLVVAKPTDANVTNADILAVVQRLVDLLKSESGGLALSEEIFVSLQQ